MAKIGLDYGETLNGAVIDGHYDPIGLCVDRCARLCSESQENGIAFSSDFNKKLKTSDKKGIHDGIESVKGIHGRIESVQKITGKLKGLGKLAFYNISLDF